MTDQQKMSVSPEETAIQEFAACLRGSLLRPSDAGYEQTRQVYNAMIDKHPALIARCMGGSQHFLPPISPLGQQQFR